MIDRDSVMITTINKVEDNDKLIIGMYDAEGMVSTVNLHTFFNPKAINQTSITEENPQDV